MSSPGQTPPWARPKGWEVKGVGVSVGGGNKKARVLKVFKSKGKETECRRGRQKPGTAQMVAKQQRAPERENTGRSAPPTSSSPAS